MWQTVGAGQVETNGQKRADATSMEGPTVLIDGQVAATTLAGTGTPCWGQVVEPRLEPQVLERGEELAGWLELNERQLLAEGAGDRRLHVSVGWYSTKLARREAWASGSRQPAGVGLGCNLVSSDGWAAFAVRSGRTDTDKGKVVCALGEAASASDVHGGQWQPARTLRRALREEAGLEWTDVHVYWHPPVILADIGDVDLLATVDTHYTRRDLETLMLQAPDSWERDELVWWPLDDLAALLVEDVNWSTWGAAGAAALAAKCGLHLDANRRIQTAD
jgi:hypothetical protein